MSSRRAHLLDGNTLNGKVMELYYKREYKRGVILANRSLKLAEKKAGPDHPDVARSLNKLAALYYAQGQRGQAKPLYERALAILEKVHGADHPVVTASLNNFAFLYDDQDRYRQPRPVKRPVGRASVIEKITLNSQFGEFGDYLQRMFDAIGFQFQVLAKKLNLSESEISTRVIVEYDITRKGEVTDLRIISTSAGRPSTLICEDAIQATAPFGSWTEEMVETLGEEQTIRITFLYQ